MSEKQIPRLMAAAKEFNIGRSTLIDFLVSKGFSRESLSPIARLSQDMYKALQSEFKNEKEAKLDADNITLASTIVNESSTPLENSLDLAKDDNNTPPVANDSDVAKLTGPKILGKIPFPKSVERIRPINDDKRKRQRIPIEKKLLTEPQKNKENKEQKPLLNAENNENTQKEIWRYYIQAKKKFTERISNKIKINPLTWQLNNGILKAEIDIAVDDNKVNDLVKKSFTINGVEPSIMEIEGKLSHFSVSTSKAINKNDIELFREQASKYYLDFVPLPAIEGVFNSSHSKTGFLNEFFKSNGINGKIYKDDKRQLTLKEISKLDKFIIDNPGLQISREDSIGCVLSFELNRQKRELNSRIIDKSNLKYLNEGTAMLYGEVLESSDLERISEKYGIDLINCTIEIVLLNNQENLNENTEAILQIEKFPFVSKVLKFKSSNNNYSRLIVWLDTLHHTNDAMARISEALKRSSGDLKFDLAIKSLFYFRSDMVFENDKLNLSFDELKANLKFPEFHVSPDTISFDFKSQGELKSKLEKVMSFGDFQYSYRFNNHKFKVKINTPNQFETIEAILRNRYKSIKTKYNPSLGTLQVMNHYLYVDPESQNLAAMQFKGVCEELASGNEMTFKLIDEFEIKFFAEVNEELKAFEENQKFQKLRNAEVSFEEKVIGKIFKCNYPNIEIRVNDLSIHFLNSLLTENKFQLYYIKPELKGELEKISRLEAAIERIENDSESLINPKVAEYIYDSSKAEEITDSSQLLEGSETWNEIVFHKNENNNLNSSQIRGVISSLLTSDLAILQGPPGTGKSSVISEIIWQHIRKQPRTKILLTSETHLAVDNALEKVGKLKSNLVRPIRFGVEEDGFELEELFTDVESSSKVEAEGKRYSAKRIEAWMSADINHPYIDKMKDNAVFIWMKKIGNNSSQNTERIDERLREKWRNCLSNASKELKELFGKTYFENVNVVGATSSSIAEKTLEGKPTKFTYSYCELFAANRKKPNINFDVVITDEASKATPPELLLPLLFGKKSIIVGDHRQLPPMLDENDFSTTLKNIGEHRLAKEFSKMDVNESQFQRLFDGLDSKSSLRTTFDRQYRMHSSINQVIEQFYKQDSGGLFCGLDPLQENLPDLNNPQSRWHGLHSDDFINEDTHCVWVNVDHPEMLEGTSRSNFGEVEACRRILNLLKESKGFEKFQNHWHKEEDKEIGLISFYGKQLSNLKQMASQLPEIPLRISTVDRFQGMERNIIIVSMVRSNKITTSKEAQADLIAYPDSGGFAAQSSLGFAELPNRLNVALSRAKRLLIIVGNIEHFKIHPIYKNVFEVISASKNGKIIEDYRSLPE